jgi:hypothetical protein
MAWYTAVLSLLALGLVTFAQDRTPPPSLAVPAKVAAARDLSKLSPLQLQMHRAALRGAEWLRRANGTDGRFVAGYLPALRKPLEGHDYLHQVRAAYALARTARLLGDERHAAIARQALLTLLLDTATDPKDPQVRHPTLPVTAVGHLAAVGWLILTIHELPNPGDDLLEQGEQLCQFIRKLQLPDGSLRFNVQLPDVSPNPNLALYALMRSQRHRSAAWKEEVCGKAMAYSLPLWQKRQPASWTLEETQACAEWCVRTKDRAFAEVVFKWHDALCAQQQTRLDPRHPHWLGGFPNSAGSQPAPEPTQDATATCAESLAQACRIARQLGDLPRYQRYREALEGGLQFLTTFQYTEANTQHFADWYRPALLGGFHVSHHDGTLRLDHTSQAVAVLVRYLEEE